MNKSDESCLFFFFWDCAVADHLFDCSKLDGVCSSSTDLKIITIFQYVKRSSIFVSNTCGAIVKKKKRKKEKKTVHSTNEDWSWKISPFLCWTFRNWFVLYFNFLSLIVTYSSQFTWQGHRKLQWAMSEDEPLLSNCPLETAEPSRNYARVPGYKKNTKKKTRKRREKKRKMNGVEINTRAYVATRLLLRWDYLYAVTLKTKVFGDYNHARLEVSWITSTRGLLLRGYTGPVDLRELRTRAYLQLQIAASNARVRSASFFLFFRHRYHTPFRASRAARLTGCRPSSGRHTRASPTPARCSYY